ncbi:hypothetical protein V8C86DRAFT_2471073 [Haematococcus lacustris]
MGTAQAANKLLGVLSHSHNLHAAAVTRVQGIAAHCTARIQRLFLDAGCANLVPLVNHTNEVCARVDHALGQSTPQRTAAGPSARDSECCGIVDLSRSHAKQKRSRSSLQGSTAKRSRLADAPAAPTQATPPKGQQNLEGFASGSSIAGQHVSAEPAPPFQNQCVAGQQAGGAPNFTASSGPQPEGGDSIGARCNAGHALTAEGGVGGNQPTATATSCRSTRRASRSGPTMLHKDPHFDSQQCDDSKAEHLITSPGPAALCHSKRSPQQQPPVLTSEPLTPVVAITGLDVHPQALGQAATPASSFHLVNTAAQVQSTLLPPDDQEMPDQLPSGSVVSTPRNRCSLNALIEASISPKAVQTGNMLSAGTPVPASEHQDMGQAVVGTPPPVVPGTLYDCLQQEASLPPPAAPEHSATPALNQAIAASPSCCKAESSCSSPAMACAASPVQTPSSARQVSCNTAGLSFASAEAEQQQLTVPEPMVESPVLPAVQPPSAKHDTEIEGGDEEGLVAQHMMCDEPQAAAFQFQAVAVAREVTPDRVVATTWTNNSSAAAPADAQSKVDSPLPQLAAVEPAACHSPAQQLAAPVLASSASPQPVELQEAKQVEPTAVLLGPSAQPARPAGKINNVISVIRSFLPILAPPSPQIAAGKKVVKVKALEQAQAAKRAEEARAASKANKGKDVGRAVQQQELQQAAAPAPTTLSPSKAPPACPPPSSKPAAEGSVVAVSALGSVKAQVAAMQARIQSEDEARRKAEALKRQEHEDMSRQQSGAVGNDMSSSAAAAGPEPGKLKLDAKDKARKAELKRRDEEERRRADLAMKVKAKDERIRKATQQPAAPPPSAAHGHAAQHPAVAAGAKLAGLQGGASGAGTSTAHHGAHGPKAGFKPQAPGSSLAAAAQAVAVPPVTAKLTAPLAAPPVSSSAAAIPMTASEAAEEQRNVQALVSSPYISQGAHRTPGACKAASRLAATPGYEVSPYRPNSDSEGDELTPPKRKPIPSWAQSLNVLQALKAQQFIDPDKLFGERLKSCNLPEVFAGMPALSSPSANHKKHVKRDLNKRGSSGNWVADRITWQEEVAYKRCMGYF